MIQQKVSRPKLAKGGRTTKTWQNEGLKAERLETVAERLKRWKTMFFGATVAERQKCDKTMVKRRKRGKRGGRRTKTWENNGLKADTWEYMQTIPKSNYTCLTVGRPSEPWVKRAMYF